MFEKRIRVLAKVEKSMLLQTILNKYKAQESIPFVTYNVENKFVEIWIAVKCWNIFRMERDLIKHLNSSYIGIRS